MGKRTGKLRANCTFRIVVPLTAKNVAEYLGTDAIASKRSKVVRART